MINLAERIKTLEIRLTNEGYRLEACKSALEAIATDTGMTEFLAIKIAKETLEEISVA